MSYRTIFGSGLKQPDEEAIAAEAGIYPGMLIELNSSGYVKKHATEGGIAEMLIASEDEYQGKVVSDVYTSGEKVFFNAYPKGTIVHVLLAAGETAVISSKLISGGDGTVKVSTNVSSGVTIAQYLLTALEALDLSGSGAVNTLIRARVM